MWNAKGSTCLACAWFYAYPYLTGELNYGVSGLGFSMKARQVLPEGLIIISIPSEMMSMMIENLQEMEWEPHWFNLGRDGFVQAVKDMEARISKDYPARVGLGTVGRSSVAQRRAERERHGSIAVRQARDTGSPIGSLRETAEWSSRVSSAPLTSWTPIVSVCISVVDKAHVNEATPHLHEFPVILSFFGGDGEDIQGFRRRDLALSGRRKAGDH